MPQPKTLRIGHRGAAAHSPENTMESFRMAFDRFHCDTIEFDIRFSKDQIPIVLHDAKLDRTTNGKGYACRYTFQELQKFTPRIPAFEELLAAFSHKLLCVEIKEKEPAVTDAVMTLIRKYKAESRCVVGSKYEAVWRQMSKKYRQTARFFSSQEMVRNYFAYKAGRKLEKDPMGVASMPLERCGLHFDEAGFIEYLHDRGVRVFYWTINDPKMAATLASHGADGIITDDPSIFEIDPKAG